MYTCLNIQCLLYLKANDLRFIKLNGYNKSALSEVITVLITKK